MVDFAGPVTYMYVASYVHNSENILSTTIIIKWFGSYTYLLPEDSAYTQNKTQLELGIIRHFINAD